MPEPGFWIRAAWLVPFFPLLGCLIVAVAGRALKGWSHLPVIAGIALAFVVSLFLWGAAGRPGQAVVYPWIELDQLSVPIVFQVDGLTSLMLSMVTFVAMLVAIFAAGYMAGDPAYPRFFACVGLFVFSMTGLVLSANYALTYAFWEGVGVCSYLLVGFWHSKPSAAAAAQKAFLVNRFGDFGFMAALLLLWTYVPGHSLNYADALSPSGLAAIPDSIKFWIAFALFWGATAKSAQVPLYVWLPDAMEGPTPVSALIHAATMVTAGVYLVARSTPLVVLAPEVQVIVAVIGCATALISALIALTQTDLKRVLAYSTISQLGYMFMGLGAGIGKGVQFAVVAGMFHLFTHAFFKALLFLGSGSVMHAMGGVIDMRKFGGLRKRLPWTHLTFGIGALALSGLPPLAGFWSKDEILVALGTAGEHAHEIGKSGYGPIYAVVSWTALFTAFLTAFYTGRAYFLTFWGPERLPSPEDLAAAGHGSHDTHSAHEAHDHAAGHDSGGHGDGHDAHFGHESPPIMIIPLAVLAVCATLVGLVFGPTGWFAGHLETTAGFAGEAVEHGFNFLVAGMGTLAGLAGLAAAYFMYGRTSEEPRLVAEQFGPLYSASLNKFYIDEIYTWTVVKPAKVLAAFSQFIDDYLVHGVLVRGAAWIPKLIGRDLLAPVQNGFIQFYAATAAVWLALLFLILLFL